MSTSTPYIVPSRPFKLSRIPDVETFLAHAVILEEQAGYRFDELAEACESYGNAEVAGLFRRMAHFSRLHLEEVRDRSAYRDLPVLTAETAAWGSEESPETASIMGADPYVSIERALEIALDGERAGQAFYAAVRDGLREPETVAFATAFAEEEAGHVAELEAWLARHQASA
jgi:rubrerythrin